jgi:hypothetical protein
MKKGIRTNIETLNNYNNEKTCMKKKEKKVQARELF